MHFLILFQFKFCAPNTGHFKFTYILSALLNEWTKREPEEIQLPLHILLQLVVLNKINAHLLLFNWMRRKVLNYVHRRLSRNTHWKWNTLSKLLGLLTSPLTEPPSLSAQLLVPQLFFQLFKPCYQSWIRCLQLLGQLSQPPARWSTRTFWDRENYKRFLALSLFCQE